jgi:hypothetical protein
MVVLSLSVHDLVDLTGHKEEEGSKAGGGMALPSQGGGLCTSPPPAMAEETEPPAKHPRRPAIVEVQCYQEKKGTGGTGKGGGEGGQEGRRQQAAVTGSEAAGGVDPDELRRKDLLIAILQKKLQELSQNQEESEVGSRLCMCVWSSGFVVWCLLPRCSFLYLTCSTVAVRMYPSGAQIRSSLCDQRTGKSDLCSPFL